MHCQRTLRPPHGKFVLRDCYVDLIDLGPLGGVGLQGFDFVRPRGEGGAQPKVGPTTVGKNLRRCGGEASSPLRAAQEALAIRWRDAPTLLARAAGAGVFGHAQVVEDQAHVTRESAQGLGDAARAVDLITPMAKRRRRVTFYGP